MYLNRYHVAAKIYLEQHTPQLNADVVINNNDLDNPFIV